jgi:trans-aconitate 2-methyltransferase
MTDLGAGSEGRPKEWNAAAYHLLSEPQFAWGVRVIDRLALTGNEHSLDAGCGSGRLTTELAARLPRGSVVGCDLSENMARAAARELPAEERSAVVCADLSALPFLGAFDVIFSTATFHWIQDHDRLFAELRAALRVGGRMEAQCGGGPNLASIHARADSLARELPFRAAFESWEETWHFASPEATKTRLTHVGFTSVSCWLEHTPTTFPDAERFSAFLETVVLRPYLSRLSPAEHRQAFLQALVAEASRDDPPFTLDYWRLNISAATL